MISKIVRRAAVGILMSVGLTVGVHAKTPSKLNTNREVIQTYAQVYLEAREYQQAEKVIWDYLASDDQDPQLWNLLGLVRLMKHDYQTGCVAFKTASDLSPNDQERSMMLYNLADCFFQAGRTDDAKTTLRMIIARKDAVRNSAELSLDQMISNEINPGQPLSPVKFDIRGKLRMSAMMATGYDSNVLLTDDLTTQTGGVSNSGSLFMSPGMQLGYVGTFLNQRLDTRFVSTFTNYFSSAAQGFNLLYQRSDALLGSGTFKYGLTQDLSFINREPFQMYSLNAGPTFQKLISRHNDGIEWKFELPIRYRFFYFDRNAADDNNRSGIDINASAQFIRVFPEDIYLSSQLILGPDLTNGKNFRMMKAILPTTVMMSLPGFRRLGLKNSFGLLLSGQYYWQSSLDRRDWMVMPNVGVSKPISQKLRLSLDYALQKNFSTLTTARYLKHLVTLAVNYELF